MKMIRMALLSLMAVATFSAKAQSHVEAKKLLTEASEKVKALDHLYIEFKYDFVNKRVDPPVTQEETGSIAIKGDDYHLNFMQFEQIRKGAKLYTILSEDEEVQVTTYEAEDAEQGLTPSNIFDLYQKGYSYKLGGTAKENGRTIQYVILKPTASEEVDKIMVGIDKASKQFVSFKQWGNNGTETTFTITSYAPNKELPAGYFSFNKSDYPGYYIAE